MKRSFGFCVVLISLVGFPMGCSPEAVKDMGKESAASAKAAADKMAEKTKGAAGDMASATGLADMMGKAQDALKSVEGGSDMLKNVSETFAKATSTFKGVTDTDSATAALPEISKLTESFGGFSDMFGKLPDAAKGAVSSVFTSALGELKPVLSCGACPAASFRNRMQEPWGKPGQAPRLQSVAAIAAKKQTIEDNRSTLST